MPALLNPGRIIALASILRDARRKLAQLRKKRGGSADKSVHPQPDLLMLHALGDHDEVQRFLDSL